VGASESEARALILEPSNAERGTPRSLITAAKRNLTGSKYSTLTERTPTAYSLRMNIRTAESDLANGSYLVNKSNEGLSKIIADLNAVKPAGLIMTLVVSDTATVDELAGTVDELPGDVDSL
jgi:hypothetical protein